MTTTQNPLIIEYEDIKQRFAEAGVVNREKLYRTLEFIKKIVNEDSKIKEWILKRKKTRVSGFNLQDIHEKPFRSHSLMGHNPGNNKVISFSLLLKTSGDETVFEACITQDEYQYQSEHSSGFHWNRIIVNSKVRAHSFSPGFSPEGSDSLWIMFMCNQMSTFEDTRKFLNLFIEYTTEQYKRCREDC